MYAAAQAKPQFFEAEHLGPAAISGPHLVATYKPGREIYAQGDLNDKCYQVSSGAARVYHPLSDGRRQVVSFHPPGEMFGFEAGPTILLCQSHHGNDTGRLRTPKEITWQLWVRLGSATRVCTQVHNLRGRRSSSRLRRNSGEVSGHTAHLLAGMPLWRSSPQIPVE